MKLFILVGCEGDDCNEMKPGVLNSVQESVKRDSSWGDDEPFLDVDLPEGWKEIEWRPWRTDIKKVLCTKCLEARDE